MTFFSNVIKIHIKIQEAQKFPSTLKKEHNNQITKNQ